MLPIQKLDDLRARHREVEEMLCQPDVLADASRLLSLQREHGELSELVSTYAEYQKVERQLEEDKEALTDPELREMVEEEIPLLESELAELTKKLELLLLPSDPNDQKNTILEIRSGAGGEEAALFAADLFRMYTRYAEGRGWKVELLSESFASAGGYKEVIVLIKGDRVYSQLRFEGGVHRVQRVPVTESQGRIHTSTATVAVLPEAEEVDLEIRPEDLQITIAAAGGPGGQGVNTTNSAVQIIHLPTGELVKCQDERSQHKNKARAMSVLRARLLERERAEQAQSVAAERRGMVGSGDRSEKIRTYNFPQSRITDHRLQLTLHKLEAVLNGDLDPLLTALRSDYQASLLAAQSEHP